MEAIVVINEQHSLLEEQKNILKENFQDNYRMKKIPKDGLKKDEIIELAKKLSKEDKIIVVLSPIPLLLKMLAGYECPFFVFHNDNRVKKELPNGKIIMTVAQTGWELI